MIRLIINADDLGYNLERDKGIMECFKNSKSISSTSVLANGLYAESALKTAIKFNLPIGLHFNITEGKPLSKAADIKSLLNESGMFVGKQDIISAVEKGALKFADVKHEMEMQIKWFYKTAGYYPTHVDGHNHVHIMPIVRQAFAETMQKYGIKWTRMPIDETVKGISNIDDTKVNFTQYILSNSKIAQNTFDKHGLQYPSTFLGMYLMGSEMSVNKIEESLKSMIRKNRDVICEVMTHPGHSCVGEGGCGSGADDFSRSKDREHELNILQSSDLQAVFSKYKVQKISYAEI